MNYKRQRSVTTNDDHISSTPPQSPGYFFQKYAPSLFNTRQHDRRKSVLVINQENRLIPLTSPVVKRSSLTSHQRSLPSTPLPRRYARRKSLSVITPRTRRRCESEEQIQVTMEAARFDVTSIYSSKSVMSLAPAAVVNKKPAVGRSVQKLDEEVSPTDWIELVCYFILCVAGGWDLTWVARRGKGRRKHLDEALLSLL